MNLNLISFIYLPLGLVISFLLSYLYLRRYPKEDVKFAYYFSVFVFGLVIFNIFLIPYDIAVAGYVKLNGINFTLFDNLDIYYLIFGFFSQIVGDVVSPIMIYIEISGFYHKGEITLEVLKSFFTDFFELIKLIVIILVSIPTTINLFVIQGQDVMELLRIILLYLNFFPYLEILYYIGFVSQDLVYSVLKKKYKGEWRYFDLWKLGKIYKYYFREREVVNKRFEEITNDIDEALDKYHMVIPKEFMDHYTRFKKKVEDTQSNLLFLVSEQKSVRDATLKHKEEEMKKNESLRYDADFYKQMFQYVDKEEKTVKKQIDLDSSNQFDDSMSNLNESELDYSEDDDYDEFEGMSEQELREQLGSDYETMMEKRNRKLKAKQNTDYVAPIHVQEQFIFTEKKFQSFENLKNHICSKMTKVIKASNSVQRKSHLISQKGIILLDGRHYNNTYSNWRLLPIALYFGVLIFFELPFNIYEFFGEDAHGFVFDLVFGIVTTSFYFFIFNYATINHKYISGNLIFGKNKSSNFNFYKFISFILCFSDALFFHSVWVMKKNMDDYDINVKYFEVFNLPQVLIREIDIIPYLSLLIIIVCVFNAAKFSSFKLKIKKCNFSKVIFLFNENADFFYNEENLFSNFILGCGVLFCIKKNMNKIMQLLGDIL